MSVKVRRIGVRLEGDGDQPLIKSVDSAIEKAVTTVINAAIGNQARFDQMRAFFGDTGQGDRAGVWSDTPVLRPEFRAETRRQVIKIQKRRKAEEMG